MAVEYVKQMWTGQTASDDITRHRQYTTAFEVLCDSLTDDATIAGSATGLPRLGDPYANDTGAWCVNVSPTRDEENPFRWFVTISYDTELPFKGEAQQIDPNTGDSSPFPNPATRENNPVLRPPRWKYGFTSFAKVARYARHGVYIVDLDGNFLFDSNGSGDPGDWTGAKPDKVHIAPNDDWLEEGTAVITNSAGDPFDPPIEVEESRLTIDISWSAYAVNHILLAEMQDAVNESEWYGFPARTVRVRMNEASNGVDNAANIWDRHVLLEVNPDTWDLDPLDRGTREWIAGSENPDPDDPATQSHYNNFKNIDGSESVEFLDGAGLKLTEEDVPVIMYYRYYKEREFSLLGIPG